MADPKIDSVSFERLLSYRPQLDGPLAFEQPTLRDMAFDFYCKKYKDNDRANEATKEYLDAIWKRFGEVPAPKPEQKTIRELYPTAICNTCEWTGPRSDLLPDAAAPLDELCPECGSADTEWAPAMSGKHETGGAA